MAELLPPAVNLTLLVALLFYFLRKPVKNMIATRSTLIRSQVEEAQAQKLEADKRFREFNDKLTTFESEAKQVLERARNEGNALREKIINDAKSAAARIISEAEATAAANVQEYKDRIRRETIAKAVDEAERMIRSGLSSDDQRRIVNEYVGKVQQQ